MFRTLFSRMIAIYLGVTLGLLLLLGAAIAVMFNNQYMAEQEQELVREAEEINDIIINKYVYSEKRLVAADELRVIARKYDALIQIVDSNSGRMSFMYPGSEDKWYGIDSVDISELAGSVKNGSETPEVISGLYTNVSSLPIMTLIRPIVTASGERQGAILFHVDMSSANASISQIFLEILLSGCIAVILAVFAVSYFTGKITRPVVEMNRQVKRYSAGDFDTRVQAVTKDEIGQLAESFNTMAEELNTLEQARKSFVANVSHELRSPLTSMRGFLEAMQDGTIPASEHAKYLDIVIAENRRMTDMVNDLLDLARIESGQYVLKNETFDIDELIRRTLLTFEARISKKKLDVEVDLQEEACFVEADSSQITQVLRNLIDNSIKFSPEGSRLRLSSRCDKKCAYVSIKDSGCGMAKDDLDHIFDRFYKAEKAHTPNGNSGTGLGLSIVKRIIDQHEQTISVTSEPGVGTEFVFSLKRVNRKTVTDAKADKFLKPIDTERGGTNGAS